MQKNNNHKHIHIYVLMLDHQNEVFKCHSNKTKNLKSQAY